jgi:ABC-2 type transport system ATP-binding protein
MVLERSLEDLQGGFVKAQVAFADGAQTVPVGLDVLHSEVQGRLRTMVVRGAAEVVEQQLLAQGATFVNVLPLSLEEIFIYEMGGAHHEDR